MRYAKAIGEEFATAFPEVAIDWNILLAGAVCHDVGKPFEFDPANRKRWKDDPAGSGLPTFRHSVFGMHVCLTVGLPTKSRISQSDTLSKGCIWSSAPSARSSAELTTDGGTSQGHWV